jgi:hypothetical protein
MARTRTRCHGLPQDPAADPDHWPAGADPAGTDKRSATRPGSPGISALRQHRDAVAGLRPQDFDVNQPDHRVYRRGIAREPRHTCVQEIGQHLRGLVHHTRNDAIRPVSPRRQRAQLGPQHQPTACPDSPTRLPIPELEHMCTAVRAGSTTVSRPRFGDRDMQGGASFSRSVIGPGLRRRAHSRCSGRLAAPRRSPVQARRFGRSARRVARICDDRASRRRMPMRAGLAAWTPAQVRGADHACCRPALTSWLSCCDAGGLQLWPGGRYDKRHCLR